MSLTGYAWLEENADAPLLSLAALFEGELSIDWVQALSKTKATGILRIFERFSQTGVLKKHELGVYSFADVEKRETLREMIPAEIQDQLHYRIAELFLYEVQSTDGLSQAASQLLHIRNGLEGCRLLRQAGDQYRRKGRSFEALACYNKALQDLTSLKGSEEDVLFVEITIGFSKDHGTVHHLKKLIPYLHEALERSEQCNNQTLKALVLMHLASNTYLGQNPKVAQEYLERGFALAKGINDPNVERIVITGTIISHYYSGRYKAAIKTHETSEPLFTEKYPRHRLSLRNGILVGLCYAFLGQISQGFGLIDGIRIHALNIEDFDTAATATANMCRVLVLKGEYDEAIALSLNSLADSRVSSEFSKVVGVYLLAYCYFCKGQFETSKKYMLRTMKMCKKRGYDIHSAPDFTEICLAAEQGDYPRLNGLSPKKEIQKATKGGNIAVKGVAHRCLAILAGMRHDYEERLHHLTRSLALLEESGYRIEIAKTEMAIGRHWLQTGDVEKAREFVTNAAKILYPINRNWVPEDLEHLVRDLRLEDNLLEEIFKLGQEVMTIRDTHEVVQHIFSTINRITGAERGAIFLKTGDPDTVPVKLWAAKNLTASDVVQPEFSLAMDMICQTAETGQAGIQNLPPAAMGAAYQKHRILSRICVPLSVKGSILGVLYHDNRFLKSTFKEQDVKILTYFASLAASALDNALAYEEIRRLNQRLNEEKKYLEEQQLVSLHLDDFVAASPAIKNVLSMVQRVAETESTVLILGETGVGKEMVARAIHMHSQRVEKPFIRVHCGALPESLIPSELFGHERGAFTGAVERRIGRFELADGGTLFLDEIGEISMEVQVRLLRVLQTGEFELVGGRQTLRSDFRLLVATNRNLEEAVAAGRFRSDLYYRLNVFPIVVPPLRERKEDIGPLASYFLRVYSEKMGKSFDGIPEVEMAKLTAYHWPGNVRELENVVERGVILNAGGLFCVPELAVNRTDALARGRQTLKEIESSAIIKALELSNWKVSGPGGAAEMLDINYGTLYSRMKKLGIKRPSKLSGSRPRL